MNMAAYGVPWEGETLDAVGVAASFQSWGGVHTEMGVQVHNRGRHPSKSGIDTLDADEEGMPSAEP